MHVESDRLLGSAIDSITPKNGGPAGQMDTYR
jgi:hypothetical protein